MRLYGIRRLIKQWGHDQVVNVGQRASLYRVIDKLEKMGFMTAGGTDRDERYPSEPPTTSPLHWVTTILRALQDGSLSWNARPPHRLGSAAGSVLAIQ